jgi:sulfonate transport system permease protein
VKRRLGVVALELWLPVVLVAAWWLLTENANSLYFPALSTILQHFKDTFLSSGAKEQLQPSLTHLVVGFAIAAVAGIGGGVLIGLNRWARAACDPWIHFFRALPGPALLPFAIIAFGIGASMKVWIIAFTTLFPILLNTIDGVRAQDPTTLEMARAYGIGGAERLRRIVVPAASPQIFAGLRTSLSIALILMVISEMVASTNGIGNFVLQSQRTFAIPDMWSGILLLGLLGIALSVAFAFVERRALRWHRGARGAARAR